MREDLKEAIEPIMSWHEGEPVTNEHRHAMAAWMARSFNLSEEKEASLRDEYEQLPDLVIARGMASLIATVSQMHSETFERAFPYLSQSEGLSFIVLREQMKKKAEELERVADVGEDLGDVG